MHYSGGFLIWLTTLIKLQKDFLGNTVTVAQDTFHYEPDGEYKRILIINGVAHELVVRPAKSWLTADKLVEQGGM